MIDRSIDYDGLMQANLARVFGERDASRRAKAIAELYADDATLYEPPDASATGHAAINQAVEALLANLPPSFAFTAISAPPSVTTAWGGCAGGPVSLMVPRP